MKPVLNQCEMERTDCTVAPVGAWIQPCLKELKTEGGNNIVSTGRTQEWMD